ncbi:MAG TPA: DUF882 domain-containing protein [Vicinamibacteria bacterium]|nr:DUF882 domain-containing protein [Vicinamibacteria bacterium]
MMFGSKIAARASMAIVVLGGLSLEARADVLSSAFVHTHTGESIAVDFKEDGVYLPVAVQRLKRFLRDHRDGEVHDIDPRLFDILYEIRKRVGAEGPFHLISCYRVRLPGVDTGYCAMLPSS